ncbi:MAG: alpha/beta hydrolase [Leptospira sp.]|nr:alpha/beta hydrolase [Leptospira sp.]
MQEKTLQFFNSKLTYYDSETHLPTIFFCHANGYSAGCYRTYFRELTKNYRVVALDFIGHGKSESNLQYDSWYFFRDQILSVIEKESLSNITGIGHSLGGASLLLASVKNPIVFRKILALDPVILGIKLITLAKLLGNPLAKSAVKRRTEFQSIELVRRAFKKFPQFANFDSKIFEDYLESCFVQKPNSKEVMLAGDPQVEAKTFSMAHYSVYFQFYKLKNEAHICIPNPFEVCSPTLGNMLIRNNPKSSLTIWDDTTHFFPFEKPKETLHWIYQKLSC